MTIRSMDPIGCSSILPWQQLDACRPSFCKGCGLQDETVAMYVSMGIYSGIVIHSWQHSIFAYSGAEILFCTSWDRCSSWRRLALYPGTTCSPKFAGRQTCRPLGIACKIAQSTKLHLTSQTSLLFVGDPVNVTRRCLCGGKQTMDSWDWGELRIHSSLLPGQKRYTCPEFGSTVVVSQRGWDKL